MQVTQIYFQANQMGTRKERTVSKSTPPMGRGMTLVVPMRLGLLARKLRTLLLRLSLMMVGPDDKQQQDLFHPTVNMLCTYRK